MDYGSPDGTNVDYLIGPRPDSLSAYLQTHLVFKCPSDRSTTLLGERRYPRVRSYSMNGAMGNAWTFRPYGEYYLPRAQANAGSRAEYIIFVDTHEDWINYCTFVQGGGLSYRLWSNTPASRHNRGGTYSFMDGRVEYRRWKSPHTTVPFEGVSKKFYPLEVPTDDPDCISVTCAIIAGGSFLTRFSNLAAAGASVKRKSEIGVAQRASFPSHPEPPT